MSESSQRPMHATTASVRLPGKKPYTSPQLREYGELRQVTLGPSPGIGDSGGVPQQDTSM